MEENKNKISLVAKMFLTWIKNVFIDFFSSFKYNNMKLSGILIALPGVFIGFFLKQSIATINHCTIITENNFMAAALFMFMLFSILNIFSAASIIGNKNLGSVVGSMISTILLTCFAVLFLSYFFQAMNLHNTNGSQLAEDTFAIDSDAILTIIYISVSVLGSFVGVILGFINYDRTYEKVKR